MLPYPLNAPLSRFRFRLLVNSVKWFCWCSCLINIPASDGGTSTPTRVYIIYTLIVGFIIPVTLISIFYTMLVAELQRRRMPTHQSGSQRRPSAAAAGRAAGGGRKIRTRKITWLVTTVVAVYVVCWLPYWTFQVIIFTGAKPRRRESGRVQPPNQSINQSFYIAPQYRGACYSAVMPNQRQMS